MFLLVTKRLHRHHPQLPPQLVLATFSSLFWFYVPQLYHLGFHISQRFINVYVSVYYSLHWTRETKEINECRFNYTWISTLASNLCYSAWGEQHFVCWWLWNNTAAISINNSYYKSLETKAFVWCDNVKGSIRIRQKSDHCLCLKTNC